MSNQLLSFLLVFWQYLVLVPDDGIHPTRFLDDLLGA